MNKVDYANDLLRNMAEGVEKRQLSREVAFEISERERMDNLDGKSEIQWSAHKYQNGVLRFTRDIPDGDFYNPFIPGSPEYAGYQDAWDEQTHN